MDRRDFMRHMGFLIWLPLIFFIEKITRSGENYHKQKSIVRIPKGFPEGITFFGEVIAVKKNGRPVFYSSRCTHLGCLINKETNGVIRCNCHGSSFDAEGNVLSGPAAKPLQKLKTRQDQGMNYFLVETLESQG